MPRWLRAGLALAVLAALGLAGLGWWLSRYVASDAFAARLGEAVREVTGQEPHWASLEVGVLPPRVRVVEARLGDGSGLAVARADLRVALVPLLARTIVIDRVSVEGAVLRAVRGAGGVVWPWQDPGAGAPVPGAAPRARGGAEAGREGAGRARAGFDLAVRRLDVAATTLTLEDRTVDPPVTLRLSDLEARARARGLAALSFSGSARVGEGVLRIEGAVDGDRDLDARLTLERLSAAGFAPYLGRGARLAGTLDGRLALRGPAPAPDAADLELRVADAAFEVGDAAIRGPVSLSVELRGDLARPAGRFTIDATGAEVLVAGGVVRKPPGAAGTAEGRLRSGPDGRIETEQVRVRLSEIGGEGSLGVGGGRPLVATLSAPPFPAVALAALVPALAPLALDGQASLADLGLAAPPLALSGRLVLDGVGVRPGGRGPLVLRGALAGEGAGLRSDGLVAAIGGEPATLALAVTGLDGAPRYRTRIELDGVQAEPLLTALGGEPGTMTGPLSLVADLAGPVAAGDAALAGLSGDAGLSAGPGRIPGVAPFAMVVEQLEKVIGGLGDRRRERLRRFEGDRFESLTGRFTVSEGVARTDDLVIRYPGHALELTGRVRLADRSLDARGRLVLEEEAYAALAGEEPRPGGRPRVLPLASVGGTLDDPRIAIDVQAALALAATFATAGKRDELERKIDGVLGKGAGRDVLDAIDGLFERRR